jgi:hypothetical protein
MSLREAALERKMCAWVRAQGGLALKLQAVKGWPDRLFIKPGGIVMFVEFKAPGRKPTMLQAHVIQQIARAGANVGWVSCEAKFKDMYNDL